MTNLCVCDLCEFITQIMDYKQVCAWVNFVKMSVTVR